MQRVFINESLSASQHEKFPLQRRFTWELTSRLRAPRERLKKCEKPFFEFPFSALYFH